jgi:hypothetical protein
MTMHSQCDPAVLEQLHALISEALALSDAQQLHATGIALDTARLSVEDALGELRALARGLPGDASESIRNGGIPPGRG